MTERPTPEQIAQARELLSDGISGMSGRLTLDEHEIDAVHVLIAATTPSTDEGHTIAYCQLCRTNGNVAEHQCFFGPVKP